MAASIFGTPSTTRLAPGTTPPDSAPRPVTPASSSTAGHAAFIRSLLRVEARSGGPGPRASRAERRRTAAHVERGLDRLLGVHHAPALAVDGGAGDAARGVDEQALDVLGDERRVGLDHLRRDGRHDGRGEAGPVDVLVRARDDVVALDLRRHQLADERRLQAQRGVEVAVDAGMRLDQRLELALARA